MGGGGGAGLEITQGDPHQNPVDLLQGPPRDGGKTLLPLLRFWPQKEKKKINMLQPKCQLL